MTTTGHKTVDEKGNTVILVEDSKTHITVSKRDITKGDEELPGATLQILDKEGNVVEEWISGEEAHEIEGLKTGVEYTLRETIAPDGYTITSDTTFTIDETGKVTGSATISTDDEGNTILVVNDKPVHVEVKKTDIANGEEVAGAHLIVTDAEGNKVDEWVSEDKGSHLIKNLKTGVEYTLRDGYLVTTDITFTVAADGTVTTTGTKTTDANGNTVILVEDDITKVKVSKVDITKGDEELPGATLQIIDKDGKVVEEGR